MLSGILTRFCHVMHGYIWLASAFSLTLLDLKRRGYQPYQLFRVWANWEQLTFAIAHENFLQLFHIDGFN